MLEKKSNLRKIEFTFTDGKVHSKAHYEYTVIVEEDGSQLLKNTNREVKSLDDAKKLINDAVVYVNPEPIL